MSSLKFSYKVALITFGLILGLCCVESALYVAPFVLSAGSRPAPDRQRINDATVRILCLGESTTFCWGLDAYPFQLERILRARAPQRTWQVTNAGKPGTNSTEILQSLDGLIARYHPQIVVAMMGANDGLALTPWKDPLPEVFPVWISRIRLYRVASWLFQSHFRKMLFPPRRRVAETPTNNADSECGEMVVVDAAKFIGQTAAETDALQSMARGHYSAAVCQWRQLQAEYPENPHFYFWVGWCLLQNKESAAAQEQFHRGLLKEPHCEALWFGHIQCLFEQGQWGLALERLYSEDAPRSSAFLLVWQARIDNELARSQERDSAYRQAAALMTQLAVPEIGCQAGHEIVEHTIPAMGPHNCWPFLFTAEWCLTRGDYESARILYEKVLSFCGRNTIALGGLARVFQSLGNRGKAREFRQKIQSLEQVNVNPILLKNYRRLAAALKHRGIALVCLSYPGRDVYPLQRVLQFDADVVFVDNGPIFQTALAKEPFEALFTDLFAGDFGHCTATGNRLIAENVAQRMLREFEP